MNNGLRHFGKWWIVLAILIADTSPAYAYILPSHWLLRVMIERRHLGNVKDMALSLKTIQEDGTPVNERIYLKNPERARVVTFNQQPQTTIWREGLFVVHQNQGWLTTQQENPDLFALLYFPKGQNTNERVDRLISSLNHYGVDPNWVSLARHNNQPAYIIGAAVWESSKPQLWLDKQHYQPLRLIVVGRDPNNMPHVIDTTFEGYAHSPGTPTVPRTIKMMRDGTLIKQSELTALRINQSIPESYFQWSK